MIITIATNTIIFKGLLEGQLIEFIWTIIPALILIQIALPSLSLLYLMEDSPECQITLKVIGAQWHWNYEIEDLRSLYLVYNNNANSYFINNSLEAHIIPEEELQVGMFRQLETDNVVILPYELRIRTLVTSQDVIHSWTLPSLGVKADAIPGRLNQLTLNCLLPGVLYGQCSEICGSQHSRIPIKVAFVRIERFVRTQ